MKMRSIVIAGLTLAFAFQSVSAGQYYRYKNEQGNLVMERSIPPQFVRQGYDIVSESGRLLERVPPALTPEQIEKLDKEKAKAYIQKQEAAKQKEADELLLTLYSGPNDVRRALERKLQELNGRVKIEEGNIHRLQGKLGKLQEQAADDELAGRQVSDSLVSEIENIETLIVQSQQNISVTQLEMEQANKQFSAEESRIRVLLNLPPRQKEAEESVQVSGNSKEDPAE